MIFLMYRNVICASAGVIYIVYLLSLKWGLCELHYRSNEWLTQ